MKQSRLWQITVTPQMKRNLRLMADSNQCHYGIMFDTGGKAHIERINPTAKYGYVFRTDGKEN